MNLKKGQPVTLELTTEDIVMGFNAPDFKLRGDIIPGKTTKIDFTPDKIVLRFFTWDVKTPAVDAIDTLAPFHTAELVRPA